MCAATRCAETRLSPSFGCYRVKIEKDFVQRQLRVFSAERDTSCVLVRIRYCDSPGRERRTRRVRPPSDERRVGPRKTSTWSTVSWWRRRQEGGVRSARALSPRTSLLIASAVTAVVDAFNLPERSRLTFIAVRTRTSDQANGLEKPTMENNKRPAGQGPRDSSDAVRESRQLIGRAEYHCRLPTIARNRVRGINETRSEEDTRLEVRSYTQAWKHRWWGVIPLNEEQKFHQSTASPIALLSWGYVSRCKLHATVANMLIIIPNSV